MVKNLGWKFADFALNLMAWLEERLELFGAVKYTCFGKLSLLKNFIIGSSIIPGG